ncbi:MAG: hypothetical protein KGR26_00325, partial [Cyanobacteria bacterium REEB65]|nr:hypothetical protein [Cyanobacteria bacterium REEB65]
SDHRRRACHAVFRLPRRGPRGHGECLLMVRRFGPIYRSGRRLAAATGLLGVLLCACTPYELVLRRSPIDWERLGVNDVAVEAVPAAAMLTLASGSIEPASYQVQAATLSASPADLAKLSASAAELLRFALEASALDVRKVAPAVPRLEIGVTDVCVVDRDDSPTEVEPESSSHESRSPWDPGGKLLRATLHVRLLAPGQAKPLWSKEAKGWVEYQKPDGFLSLLDASSSAAMARDDLELLREIAVRRALKPILDELVPRYDYEELRRP